MYLSIRIKKVTDAPSVLIVERSDGSKTYSKLEPDFEIHDIAHFVVEKQLNCKNAFYGMLAQGYRIDEFQLPKEVRPRALWPQNMPQEAFVTEHLVNLLTIDFMQSETEMDIAKILESILKDKGLPFPSTLDNEKLASIRNELSDLMAKWNELQRGKELKLRLEI